MIINDLNHNIEELKLITEIPIEDNEVKKKASDLLDKLDKA